MPQQKKNSKKIKNQSNLSKALAVRGGRPGVITLGHILRLGPIVPTRTRVQMPWTHYFPLVNDASTVRTYGAQTSLYYNRIGAIDPVASTHSPYGWDQMKALYGYYKVVGFECSVTVSNSTANNRAVTTFRVCPVGDISDMNGQSLLLSEKPGVTNIITVAGAGTPPKFRFKANFPEQMGVSKQQFDSDISVYGATVTADPSRSPILKIACASDTVSVGVYCLIEAIFTVEFWQRTSLATS